MYSKALIVSLLACGWVAGASFAGSALAWGDSGHRMIGEAAMCALPPGLPAFLSLPSAVTDVGQYSREPDMWRKAGAVHDSDRDAAHLIKLDDDGKTLGGDALDALPATRTLYEVSLRTKGADPAKIGYLPYSLVDAYQQVTKDFAFLRVIDLAETHEKDKAKRLWLKNAQRRREDLTLRDIGILSHYVGDATQPMHLSIHYDGWGDYPNPEGFTTAAIHWPLEAEYVRSHVTPTGVQAAMAPLTTCTDKVELCVAHRLQRNFSQVLVLYRLEKDGGFKPGDPRGGPYMTGLIARGASDLRDMISDAWRESTTMPVSFAGQTYANAIAGKIPDLYLLLYGDS